ncbi:MAG: RNA polymerase sigma factor [Bacteroidales bacterium]|nr:RNA polymerase sigma factor [Bacteroidales bacterium]MCF8332621.1 RNA polymerase sigma factor [Bacteroidales bacterium]
MKMELTEYKTLILPLKDKLYRFARQITQHDGEAQDIVQEVFIRLWEKRNVLKQYKNVEALAMVITKNLSLDYLKTKRSKNTVLEEANTSLDHYTPEFHTEMKDTSRRMRNIFSTLPEQQRMVIHLRDVEEVEYEKIAEITGMSINNIRVKLSRARKTVREELLKQENYASGNR